MFKWLNEIILGRKKKTIIDRDNNGAISRIEFKNIDYNNPDEMNEIKSIIEKITKNNTEQHNYDITPEDIHMWLFFKKINKYHPDKKINKKD